MTVSRAARHTLAFPFIVLAIVFAFVSAGMDGLASLIAYIQEVCLIEGPVDVASMGLDEDQVRLALTLFLPVAMTILGTLSSAVAEQSNTAWIAMAKIIKNGEQSGSGGVYLRNGLILTAAHLTSLDAEMGVQISGVALPAIVLKQGLLEEVDLSLLMIDEEKLPSQIALPEIRLCTAPPWPGDPVIVVDADRATRSHIIAPQILDFAWRSKFWTLIADVATTGNSGSGVFDPSRKCLHGIMSRKFMAGGKDIAKYFVPAAEIRRFMPPEFKF